MFHFLMFLHGMFFDLMDRKSYILYYWSEVLYFPTLRTGNVLGSYFMERKYFFSYLMDRKYYSILSFNSYKKEISFVCCFWKGNLIPSYLRERESYLLLPYVQEILLLSTYGEELISIPTLWKGSLICSYIQFQYALLDNHLIAMH